MDSVQQKSGAGMADLEFLKSIAEPLAILLRAYQFARAGRVDVWQFAVELNLLWEAGLTTTDLRLLVVKSTRPSLGSARARTVTADHSERWAGCR
jgi:hypothetical protein